MSQKNATDRKEESWQLSSSSLQDRIISLERDFEKLLEKNGKKNHDFITHVMLTGGKFCLNRKELDFLYNTYGELILNKRKSFIAEIPQKYTALVVDVDLGYSFRDEEPELKKLYRKGDVEELITIFREVIRELVEINDEKDVRCVFLSKKPYLEKNKLKHGFHLHFPFLFLNRDDIENYIVPRVKELIDKKDGLSFDSKSIDSVSKKPWLLYGSSKGEKYEPYTVTALYDEKMQRETSFRNFFGDYKIYDEKEREIEIVREYTFYLPRILSVVPYGRETKKIKPQCRVENIIKPVVYEEREELPKSIEVIGEELKMASELLDLLPSEYYNERGKWMEIGWILFNISDGSEEGFRLWDSFSQKSTKYEGKLRYDWDRMRRGRYSIHSLKRRVKESNLEAYRNWSKKNFSYIDFLFLDEENLINSEERKDQFVREEDLETQGHVIISAGLGKGKTTSFMNYFDKHKNGLKRVVIVTPRISYAKNINYRLKSFGFTLYSDVKKSLISDDLVIIQAESLHRLEKYDFDLLILDECESILYQLVIGKHKFQKHGDNIDSFLNLFTTSKKIICMDAFISDRTINFFLDNEMRFSLFRYTTPNVKRRAFEIDYDPKEDRLKMFTDFLIEDLDAGKKIYFFCSSKNKLNEILGSITKRLPEKRVSVHNGDVQTDFETIQKQWDESDLVITTSSITVGINYDRENVFHKIYVYASGDSRNLVRDIFQSTYRVRHLIDNEMIYFINRSYNVQKYVNDINDELSLLGRKEEVFKAIMAEHGYNRLTTPFSIKNLLAYSIYEHKTSCVLIKPLFKRYLSICGYSDEKKTTMDPTTDTLEDTIRDEIDEKNDVEDKKYDEINDLTLEEVQRLKQPGRFINKEEKIMISKYFFKNYVIDETKGKRDEIIKHWEMYNNYGRKKFDNLTIEKGLVDGELSMKDLLEMCKHGYDAFNKDTFEKRTHMEKLLGIMEMKTSCCTAVITRNKIAEIGDYMRSNLIDLSRLFNLKAKKGKLKEEDLQRDKAVVGCINQIFSSWGYTKIKAGERQRVRINGKQVYVTDYAAETQINMDMIRGKKGKREVCRKYDRGDQDEILRQIKAFSE